MFGVRSLVLLACALGFTVPAHCSEPMITVETERLTPQVARQKALSFVKAGLPPNPEFDQYSRWRGPICIRVIGIPDRSVAAQVRQRIAAVVSLAGLEARPSCRRANLIVAFTDDARGLFTKVRARKRLSLPIFHPRLYAALDSQTLPVRWWHLLSPQGFTGGLGTPDTGALGSSNVGTTLPVGPNAVGTNSWSSSLVDTNLSVWAQAGIAVVDVNLATGVSLDALADYVGLVMIAPLRLPLGDPGVPSVLGLFTPGKQPAGLSEWDRAFVKGLYSVQMNRSARRQRQQMLSAMTAELVPDSDPAQP
jgi:hypothetical protein